MAPTKRYRIGSSSKIRQSISLLCFYSSLQPVECFAPFNQIPQRIQDPTSANILVRTWARPSTSSTSVVSYANDSSASSSNSSPSNINPMPVRVVGSRIRDPTELKRAAEAATRRNVESNRKDAGAWYQREEMLQHEILTKEAEGELGNAIIYARKLRDEMTEIIEAAKLLRDENGLEERFWEDADYLWAGETTKPLLDIDGDGMEFMSEYENFNAESKGFDSLESWQASLENHNFAGDQRISSTLVQDGSKLSISSIESDLKLLSEEDVRTKLNIEGGKKELREIFMLGSESRTTLMRSNIRLVVSISKKWMGSSFAAGNSNGSRAANLYNGGWDRPSLDEVIQEGVLGLARAVDKFDPGRGLRFSTYSTHWITSYVRQCFQNASTGCLKVPAQLHEIKNSYKSIVRRYMESSESLPSEEEIAAEIGVTINRLKISIRATESLLSIDEPAYSSGNAAYKGSGAGGDNSGHSNLLMLDRLQCTEIAPEDFVEISFLRQTLESAMAAELSPHERDIIRMRLGLDDGQTRTVRQVVEECGGGITVSDVRSAERRAFKKLRSPNALHAHNLAEFLDMIGADVDATRW